MFKHTLLYMYIIYKTQWCQDKFIKQDTKVGGEFLLRIYYIKIDHDHHLYETIKYTLIINLIRYIVKNNYKFIYLSLWLLYYYIKKWLRYEQIHKGLRCVLHNEKIYRSKKVWESCVKFVTMWDVIIWCDHAWQ
jgi:hypothetical protein